MPSTRTSGCQVLFFDVLCVFAKHLPSAVTKSVRDYLDGVIDRLDDDTQDRLRAAELALHKGSSAKEADLWAVSRWCWWCEGVVLDDGWALQPVHGVVCSASLMGPLLLLLALPFARAAHEAFPGRHRWWWRGVWSTLSRHPLRARPGCPAIR